MYIAGIASPLVEAKGAGGIFQAVSKVRAGRLDQEWADGYPPVCHRSAPAAQELVAVVSFHHLLADPLRL